MERGRPAACPAGWPALRPGAGEGERGGRAAGLLAGFGPYPRAQPSFFPPHWPSRALSGMEGAPAPSPAVPQAGLWAWAPPSRQSLAGLQWGAWASDDMRFSLAGSGQQPTHLHAVSLETKLLGQHSAVTHTPHQKPVPQGALITPIPLLPGPPAPPDPTAGGWGMGWKCPSSRRREGSCLLGAWRLLT